MKRKIMLLCLVLLSNFFDAHAQDKDMMKQITGRYWVYENSVWDAQGKAVHTFLERVNEGQVLAKGTGLYFDDDGTFKEVADEKKIGSKPCSGNWVLEKDKMLKVVCGGKIWHYEILQLKEGTMLVHINGGAKKAAGKSKKKK